MPEHCDICRQDQGMVPRLEISLSGELDAMIAECPRCGFHQVRPRLRREELGILYPEEYFDSESALGFGDYWRQRQRAEREAYFLARDLRRLAPRGRLLEVGCALGFLLDGIRPHCEWELQGVDVSEFGVDFARRHFGLDAYCATLEEMAYPDHSFDYVVQKDVLEHVPDPRAHLHEVARILRPGGQSWLVTPNGEANLHPMRKVAERIVRSGKDELPLQDQGHLSFFRIEHLRRLFDECGFEILRARSIGVKRGLRALGVLPMKRKAYRTAPRGRTRIEATRAEPGAGSARPSGVTVPGSTDGSVGDDRAARDATMVRVRDRIVAEMERNAKPLRSSSAYFWFRRIQDRFDTLPANDRWGNDFEFVLRKR